MPPPISVLLPCHNAAATVDETLASLVEQTEPDMEIVAVDDGSTDATVSRLVEWRERDPRIRIVQRQHEGVVAALTAAASLARGTFLARMDADDVSAPRRMERQRAYLERHTEVAACGTLVRYFPRSSVRGGARRYERWINSVVTPDQMERDLFVECPIPHPSLVVRRSAFEEVRGYRDAGWPEDYDLLLRLWQAGHVFGKVPEVLLHWREDPHRLSRTDPRYAEDAFRRCKAHYLGRRIAGRRVVVCGAGPVGKAFARALQGEGHEIAAFADVDRRKIGQMIHGALVVHPAALAEYRDAYAVAAVGSSLARTEIRDAFRKAGFREPDDCCAVA
jgi:glycosyltransferase involved in cell wall biosynthesis